LANYGHFVQACWDFSLGCAEFLVKVCMKEILKIKSCILHPEVAGCTGNLILSLHVRGL
jgi:hypothetical protein